MALFSTLAKVFDALTLGIPSGIAGALGFGGSGARFPEIPPPQRPPPPTPRAAPPRRTDPAIQAAGAEQRGLFRRRGRQTTVLTRGRGAGVRPGPGETRSVLGETIA
jgi:hypothetical protein